jgi:predicted glutamine amidotransferase
MEPEFRFCLNGEVIRNIRVQHEMTDGQPIGKWQIAVEDEAIGWFTIDDNENLWDKDLPKFVLKYATIPLTARQGWQRVTTKELLDVLESAGLIKRE